MNQLFTLLFAALLFCSFDFELLVFKSQYKIEKGISQPIETSFFFSNKEVIMYDKSDDIAVETHYKVLDIVETDAKYIFYSREKRFEVWKSGGVRVKDFDNNFYTEYK